MCQQDILTATNVRRTSGGGGSNAGDAGDGDGDGDGNGDGDGDGDGGAGGTRRHKPRSGGFCSSAQADETRDSLLMHYGDERASHSFSSRSGDGNGDGDGDGDGDGGSGIVRASLPGSVVELSDSSPRNMRNSTDEH